MTIGYQHNFHGVVRVRIGKCRPVPRNTESPDFYTRTISLFDKDGECLNLHLYGDNVSLDDNPDGPEIAREISIEMGD